MGFFKNTGADIINITTDDIMSERVYETCDKDITYQIKCLDETIKFQITKYEPAPAKSEFEKILHKWSCSQCAFDNSNGFGPGCKLRSQYYDIEKHKFKRLNNICKEKMNTVYVFKKI